MRLTVTVFLFFLLFNHVNGQSTEDTWYSEAMTNRIRIQNSYPKGGPHHGISDENHNHSYLVSYVRIVNESENVVEMCIDFPFDPFPIPNSPEIFVSVLLPQDEMTWDKVGLFCYGIPDTEPINSTLNLSKTLEPNEEYLFYVVALFYQVSEDEWEQERGGNRTEFLMQRNELFFNMPPQINAIPCGSIQFRE